MANILKKEKSNSKGFTLIELLVVISIIALLSIIFIVNYRAGGRQLAVERSAHQLAHDIRRAQAMAMATEEFEGDMPGGYGIYIKSPSDKPAFYELIVDKNNDKVYFSGDDTVITDIYFEDGVFLSNIGDSNCFGFPTGQGNWRSHIIFSPPDPIVSLSVGNPPSATYSCNEIVLTLQVGDSSGPTKSVRVNSAGLVEVE